MLKKSKLALKFVVGFILLGMTICCASSLVGYYQFKITIEKQYNDRAYRCTNVALSYVDRELLSEYIKAADAFNEGSLSQEEIDAYKNTDAYKDAKRRIENLRASMGANDVFIFKLDLEELRSYKGSRDNWKPLVYIFDSYTEPEYSYTLGDAGSFNPDYIGELEQIALTGEKSDSYFFSEGDYGYNTAALLPVLEDGDVIAIAAVEIPMTTLQASLRRYIIYAVLVTVLLITVFIIAYMIYFFRKVVSPIHMITVKTVDFVKNQNQITSDLKQIQTKDEIQNLAEGILKMQEDINHYIDNLTKVTAERERLGAELDVAKHIQSSMLPSIFPAFPERSEFDIYASMTPAKEVGGDFYDFFLADEYHLAMVMADVSGKGVPAALFMMISKTLIKSAVQSGLSPKEALEKVNNQLCENNDAEMFVTVWLGILEISTGNMVCANAGHEYPALKRRDAEFELFKDKHGLVLAGMEGAKYREYELKLEEGDKIFVYTDGVPEATDKKEELYGTDRMIRALNSLEDADPKRLLELVHEDVDRFVGSAPQFDDLTMLCLEYAPRIVQDGNLD